MDRKSLLIYLLTILLALSLSFIAYSYYVGKRTIEIQEASLAAYRQGIIDTTSSLMLQSENCQTATVVSGQTQRSFVDFSCLKKA